MLIVTISTVSIRLSRRNNKQICALTRSSASELIIRLIVKQLCELSKTRFQFFFFLFRFLSHLLAPCAPFFVPILASCYIVRIFPSIRLSAALSPVNYSLPAKTTATSTKRKWYHQSAHQRLNSFLIDALSNVKGPPTLCHSFKHPK